MNQISFDPLEYPTRESAMQARNARLRAERAAGRKATGFTLRNQLRPYAGVGIPDGRIRDVFYVQLWDEALRRRLGVA